MSKEKQIDVMHNDLNEIFDKEYGERRLVTAYHTAKSLYEKGYRKQSQWISVEERLPDEQGRFLIVDKEGQMNTAFYTPRFGWFSHFRIKNITHWMPLPEAPKGGAE